MNLILDLSGYLLGLWTARAGHWTTGDIVWGLWLSSLCAGHLIAFSVAASIAYSGLWRSAQPGFPNKVLFRVRHLTRAAGSFVFFSFHYSWAHVFMAAFLDEHVAPRLSVVFVSPWTLPLTLFAEVWNKLLPLYWPFALGTIIAERQHILAPLRKALDFIKESRERLIPIYGFLENDVGARYPMKIFLHEAYFKLLSMYALVVFLLVQARYERHSFMLFVIGYGIYYLPWRKLAPSSPKQ